MPATTQCRQRPTESQPSTATKFRREKWWRKRSAANEFAGWELTTPLFGGIDSGQLQTLFRCSLGLAYSSDLLHIDRCILLVNDLHTKQRFDDIF